MIQKSSKLKGGGKKEENNIKATKKLRQNASL